MSDHLQLIDRYVIDKQECPTPNREWDCFIHGVLVGRVIYDSNPSYGRPCYRIEVCEDDQRYDAASDCHTFTARNGLPTHSMPPRSS